MYADYQTELAINSNKAQTIIKGRVTKTYEYIQINVIYVSNIYSLELRLDKIKVLEIKHYYY